MSKMISALSMIFSLVLLGITEVSAVDTFPENFVAVEKHSNVTLLCRTAELDVTWQQDSEEVLPSEYSVLKGNQLILRDFLVDQIGNYTCWRNNKIIDYTYVLSDISSQVTDSPISCTAETFNCTYSISCRMNHSAFIDFRLRNERDSNSWVQRSESGMFYLTHSTNPYAEESDRLVVIGEAVSSSDLYFKFSHSFYLRDIIKPACPEVNVKNSKVDLQPPLTWAQPSSYYPLDHEIQCKKQDDGTVMPCTLDQNDKVPRGTIELRVRCRDALLLSQWSDWTPWQNVRNRRKNSKRKKNKKKSV
ncbi:interleukin-12 subunit beta [Salminus brasiliensis]|uniref:interleukin-12 subunit beta n=1 Tax=Salminus brasiliensis TaxID=930266 RepID=UPI003B832AAF